MLAQQSWKWSAYAMGEEGFLRDGQLSMWGAAYTHIFRAVWIENSLESRVETIMPPR